jgi:broad specificity phosphatase PhoE
MSFYSELTEKGILGSLELPQKIKKLGIGKGFNKIDIIYCSPFIRTLQTAYPMCKILKKKVNLEYGLYEYLHNPFFLLQNWFYEKSDIKDRDLLEIIDNNYKSIVGYTDFIILEDEECLERRVAKFFDRIRDLHKDKTILIVSHKGVINKIKDLYIKKTDIDCDFPMGHFEYYEI